MGAAAALGWASALAPIHPPEAGAFSAAQLERGRLLAAAGNCAACHTASDGVVNAGGRGVATPFGTVWSTNLTPDPETGIGTWSFAAFERAMRQGIGRDGRHLYPAFPYTAFAGMTEGDLLALYAHLMAQPPVRSVVPETRLAFPFNLRPLLAGWNLLFHRPGAIEPDPARTAAWNRGHYLVNALGHCGACHTPRNALGAERRGAALAGASRAGGRRRRSTGPRGRRWPGARRTSSTISAPAIRPAPRRGRGADGAGRGATRRPAGRGYPGDGALPRGAEPRGDRSRKRSRPGTARGARARARGSSRAPARPATAAARRTGRRWRWPSSTSLHSDRPDNLLRVILEGIPR